jgi:hypothetical protein
MSVTWKPHAVALFVPAFEDGYTRIQEPAAR